MTLRNKVVVVTGASDGIGREVALRLAKENVKLALVARNKEKLDDTVKKVSDNGSPNAIAYTCDLLDNRQIDETVKKIITHFKEVDALVNIAGVWQKMNYLENISDEEIDKVISTNLSALIHITRHMLPHLKEQKEAAIINLSSRSGVQALPGQTIYCASKWGVRGFTEVLKEDLKDTTVRVAGIYPAGIRTRILEKAGDPIATHEFTDPKDIAEVVVFMLSRPPKIWLHEVRITY